MHTCIPIDMGQSHEAKETPTKKGNQWHFGIKAHSGVDEESGVVHTVMTTAANVSDISQTPALLHGQEEEVGASI